MRQIVFSTHLRRSLSLAEPWSRTRIWAVERDPSRRSIGLSILFGGSATVAPMQRPTDRKEFLFDPENFGLRTVFRS